MARSQLDIILRVVDKGSRNLKKFTAASVAMGAALGAARVAGETWQAAIAGSQMLKAERSFASMARSVGQDIDEIAEAMQKASGGAISMQDAMLGASQAIRLGVAKTPEEFAKLTKAATNLGAAMGRGPVEAMNDIVRGIGRMSPLILDNIGIMTNGGKVFEDYAKKVGKSVKDLTDAEKKQVLLNKAIEDGGAIVDATATAFERLDVKIQDYGDRVKKAAAEGVEPLVEKIITKVDAIEALNRLLRMGAIEQGTWNAMMQQGKEIGWDATLQLANLQLDRQLVLIKEMADGWDETEQRIRMNPIEPEVNTEPATKSIYAWGEATQRYLDGMERKRWRLHVLMMMDTWMPDFDVGGGSDEGIPKQHGGTFTVPPGYPNDSFPIRASSGERVSVDNSERSFFGGSTVNINNGTQLEAFEEMLRTIQ